MKVSKACSSNSSHRSLCFASAELAHDQAEADRQLPEPSENECSSIVKETVESKKLEAPTRQEYPSSNI